MKTVLCVVGTRPEAVKMAPPPRARPSSEDEARARMHIRDVVSRGAWRTLKWAGILVLLVIGLPVVVWLGARANSRMHRFRGEERGTGIPESEAAREAEIRPELQ